MSRASPDGQHGEVVGGQLVGETVVRNEVDEGSLARPINDYST